MCSNNSSMATIDTNVNDDCMSKKIVFHRRSSIFNTKNIIRNEDKDDNESSINGSEFLNKKEKECNAHDNEETFNLKEYIEKLRQERKDWQQEYKNRKTRRKDLLKQKISLEEQGQALDINVLTEDERNFLLTRPNYEHICKNNQKLLDTVVKLSTLSELVNTMNTRFMERMENNMITITKSIIKMSNEQ